MRRRRRPIVFLCVAVVAFAAVIPGVVSFYAALVEPQWVLLAELTIVGSAPPAPPLDRARIVPRALVPERAPPRASVA
jgi:hypothetical protein